MFSIFTKRNRDVSARLQTVASGFKLWGALAIAIVIVGAIAVPLMSYLRPDKTLRLYPWMFPKFAVGAGLMLLQGASLIVIGRALERRQRWGAYLAGVTLAVPLVRQLLNPDLPVLSIPDIVLTTGALAALVTVWNELGTVRDAEFDEIIEEREAKLPQRNRGFREPRALGEGPAAVEQRPMSLTPEKTRNTL